MRKYFIIGFLLGAMIFGITGAFAADYVTVVNPFPVKLNGTKVDVEGYSINGSTYFKLRDVADAVGGFNVDFVNNEIVITSENAADKTEANTVLTYQGHGSAKLVTSEGKVVYIDPYAGEGYDEPADLILVTHEHSDHNGIDLMPHADGCVIFRSADAIKDGEYQTLDVYGLHVEPVQAYNNNHKIEECVGYVITVDGKVLYFAGDTSKTEQMAELADKNIDYAFLPMDGRFNMDIPETMECAELIQAKHTVPYHMAPGELFNRERAEQFVTDSAFILEPGETIEW